MLVHDHIAETFRRANHEKRSSEDAQLNPPGMTLILGGFLTQGQKPDPGWILKESRRFVTCYLLAIRSA